MKKKIIIIILIVIILIICSFFLLKKNHKKEEIILTNNFDVNLIKLVSQDNQDNYLISPYSIKIALNMLKEGANNNTYNEIDNALKNNKVNNISNQNIKIANALFIKDKYQDIILKDFTNTLKNNYNAEILYDKYQTPDVINNWVNKNTDKMIPKILDNIDNNFVLGLANAIAIDVKWSYPFECDLTTKETFINKNNQKINVEMMHQSYQTSDISYFENNNVKGIIIPYEKDTNLEFIGILPNDINDYLKNLTKEDLTEFNNLKNASNDLHINLSLPRFKYEFNLLTFKDNLISLGIKDAFNSNNADFTKIITKENMLKNNLNNLYVDEAIHKSYIDLNEKGTKAAAVTYFGLKANAMPMPNYDTIDIIFNKSFIYMIREKTTKEILFFGLVNTPNKWNGSTCSNFEN